MIDTERAFIAGFLTGRGGFGLNKDGWEWLYFRTLDLMIAAAALEEWGGTVTEKVDPGAITYKYAVTGAQVLKALENLSPYLVGYKRERAEKLLAGVAA